MKACVKTCVNAQPNNLSLKSVPDELVESDFLPKCLDEAGFLHAGCFCFLICSTSALCMITCGEPITLFFTEPFLKDSW